MRIGELTDTFLPITDGVGRVVHAYANELTAIGHHVSVIAPMRCGSSTNDQRTSIAQSSAL